MKFSWKRQMAVLLCCATVCTSLPGMTVKAAEPDAGGSTWVATPYTKEDGTLAEGLEEAVLGKSHWLETTRPMPVTVTEDKEAGFLTVQNGIIERSFKIPQVGGTEFYTESYKNLYVEKELLKPEKKPDVYLGLYDKSYREVYKDEGIKITLDPISSIDNTITIPQDCIRYDPDYYFVGGEEQGSTFVFDGYEVMEACEKPFEWTPNPVYGDPAARDWPPKGKHIEFYFSAPDTFPEAYQGIKIKVIYEMYDNISAMKKRVEVTNAGDSRIMIGRMAPEVLNGNEDMDELLTLETSYTCGDQSTLPVNRKLPCKCGLEKDNSPFRGLESIWHACYEVGPAYELQAGEEMIGYDTYEIIHSTYWFELKMRERLGVYRTLFPWITDNPLTHHNTGALTRDVIDHAAEAGFEMIIQSYSAPDSSGQMLSRSQETLDQYKELVDYAHSKGIAIGIYQAQYQLGRYKQNPEYGTNNTGQWGTWCLASAAFDDYWDNFRNFVSYTGLDCVEIDGTYPGCYCSCGEQHKNIDKETDPADPADRAAGKSSKYKFHYGVFDSQVKQWENAVRMVCREFRDMGVYIKVPAWYYLNGANKCGIGYEEAAWSQPRQEQLIYGRQIMYNASYARTMSMSWSHVPFAQYHGGGSSAAFQPFKEHKEDYNWVIAQNLGNGVNSDFRGPQLFDDGTRDILNKWVDFSKRYRGIINSDMVHISQAAYDAAGSNRQRGVALDTLYHVNSLNEGEKGLLWVYNQSDEERTEIITVPMYYTGLTSMNYPPVPLKDSTGKDVKGYGAYPPNYEWLPDSEPDYRQPDADATVRGTAAFLKEGVQAQVLEIDSNGNARLQVTLPPMSFTYYTIYKPGEQPDVSLEVGKVNGLRADSITENSAVLKWDKEVSLKLTEDGTVNEKPAITVDSYNVYRDGELIGQTFDNTFADKLLKENKEYSYTVTAVAKGVEGLLNDALKVNTLTDETALSVTAIAALDNSTIQVVFSEPADPSTAEDAGNYTIQEGLKVKSASLKDECTVALTVDDMELLTPYTLKVQNVKDCSAAGNVMEPSQHRVIFGYIAKYGFDKVSESIIEDAFGNYPGKAYNAQELNQTCGSGITLDAEKGSYADLGSGLLKGRTGYTMSLWFRTDSLQKQALLSQGQDLIAENDLTLWLEGGALKFRASGMDGTGVELTCDTALQGQWNFAAVVREGDVFTLYVNGEEADSVVKPGVAANETQNAMLLGAVKNHAGGDRTNLFTGDMSEVSFYCVPLAGTQMNLLYQSGLVQLSSLLDAARAIDAKLFTGESMNKLTAVIREIEQKDPNTMMPVEIIDMKERLQEAMDRLMLREEYKTLAALYHMDEEKGEEIANALPGYTGRFVNGQYMRMGTPFGRGVYFYDNNRNYIVLSESPLNGKKDFTVNGWFKAQLFLDDEVQKAGKQVILSDDTANLVLSLQNKKLVLEAGNGTDVKTLISQEEIPMEAVGGGEVRQAWNQFTIVYKQDTLTLYLNASPVAQDILTGLKTGTSMTIGAQRNGAGQAENQYNGLIDELSFYNYGLDSVRVGDLAQEIPFRKSEAVNLALGKTLTSDGMTDAFRLNDGKVLDYAGPERDTPWTARSAGTVGSGGLKYGIDLGAVYDIKAISLTHFFRNYKNEELRRFRDVVVQVSTSADFSSGVTTILNTDEDNSMGYGAGGDQSFFSFELGNDFILEESVRARYIRLISSGFCKQDGSYSGYVNVSELEVYGNVPEPAKPEVDVNREIIDLKVAGDREFVQVACDAETPAADVKPVCDNPEVATVTNKDGILQINAVKEGTAVITVPHPRDEFVYKEILVTVEGMTPDRIVDDSDEAVKYTGSFAQYNYGRGPDPDGVYEYERGIHYGNVQGDYAEYTFTGTGIDVITTVNTDGGLLEVSIDGKTAAAVNTRIPNDIYPKRANQMCVFSRTDLEYGEHTIKLLNKEGNITVDALRVYADESKHLVMLKDAAVSTLVGVLPKLPQTVTAVYGDGTEKQLAVIWNEVTQDQVAAKGTFTVEGKVEGIAEGSALTAKVTVTVAEGPYTITFMAEGKVYSSITAEFGQAIVMPQEPSAEGKKFLGWFTSAKGGSRVEDFSISRIVYAQFEEEPAAEYQITVSGSDANGMVSVNKTQAAKGEEVTIVSTPAEGYYVAGNSVSAGDAGNTVAVANHKFVMPAENVTVFTDFAQLPRGEHAVVISAMEHGTAAAVEKAAPDNEVAITVLPDEGYRMVKGSLTVNGAVIDKASEAGIAADTIVAEGTAAEGYTFTMPDKTAVIAAVFEADPRYAVNCAALVDGAVAADKAEAGEGETVTITVVGNVGFRLAEGSLKVTSSQGSEIVVTGTETSYTFVMPDDQVNITAVFEVIPAPKFPLKVVGGSGSGEYEEGALVKVTAAPAPEGQRFAGWTAEGITLDNPNSPVITITMPAGAVTITAGYEEDSMRQLLRRTYEYGLTLDTTGVVETAVKRFRAAMDQAEAVLEDASVSDQELEKVWEELTYSIHCLGLLQGDKSVLKILIDKAQAMVEREDKYVPQNWSKLTDALDSAKKVMGNGDAMEEDVKPAVNKLLQAILEQRFKARKDILENLMARAGEVDQTLYTEESIAVFKTAYVKAAGLMEDESLSEEDQYLVDAAAEELENAMLSLVKKDDGQGGNDPSGDGGDPSEDGNDPSGDGDDPSGDGDDPTGGGNDPSDDGKQSGGNDSSDDADRPDGTKPSDEGSRSDSNGAAKGTDGDSLTDMAASPKTGDNARAGMAVIAFLVGMACVAGVLCMKRKKRNK